MTSNTTESQLEQLRPGNLVKHYGVEWNVKEYSNYEDANGYQTIEWLLRSQSGKEYYLLREYDPKNPEKLVNWYLAEELNNPKIFPPDSTVNIVPQLWAKMQGKDEQYPELKLFTRTYYFDSLTKGTYQEEDTESYRITWDYWDKDRNWNLAIEAWPNRELHIYSTKAVKPDEFSGIDLKVVTNYDNNQLNLSGKGCQLVMATGMIIFGILLMVLG